MSVKFPSWNHEITSSSIFPAASLLTLPFAEPLNSRVVLAMAAYYVDLRDRSSWLRGEEGDARQACQPGLCCRRAARAAIQTDTTVCSSSSSEGWAQPAPPSDSTNVRLGTASTRARQSEDFPLQQLSQHRLSPLDDFTSEVLNTLKSQEPI